MTVTTFTTHTHIYTYCTVFEKVFSLSLCVCVCVYRKHCLPPESEKEEVTSHKLLGSFARNGSDSD